MTAPKNRDKPLIVLDPGHGGIDTGATGVHGTLEKAIVLDFAQLLKEKLDESGLYNVQLTRDDDTFIPLGRELKSVMNSKPISSFPSTPILSGAGRNWRVARPSTQFQTGRRTNWPKIWPNRKTCRTSSPVWI